MRKIISMLFLTVACGGITTTGDGGDIKDSGLDVTPDVVKPPPTDICPPGQTCTATFVFRTLLLGETPRQGGPPSTTAWKGYGENIDGKVTDNKSTDVCQRFSGAPTSVQTDGTNGVDNSWGANILPIIQSASSLPNPTQVLSDAIHSGGAETLLITVETGVQGTKAKLYVGGPLGKTAAFDGTDVWPTVLLPLQSAVPVLDFPNATILPDGTFVSGRATQRFAFGYPIRFVVDDLQVRMSLGPSMKTATDGTLSGVLPTDPFIAQLKIVSGAISKGLCGAAFDGIAQQMVQCQDILLDGTNTSGVPCAGISLGIGFDAAPAQLGAMSAESLPPDPCK